MRQLGSVAHLTVTPGRIKGSAPEPGQHTREILGRLGRNSPVGSSIRSNPPNHPLDGITVLDMTSVIAGPLGCSLVAELGARVIRVEAPEGDWMRRAVRGVAVHRTMAGTEAVCLDLKTPKGRKIVHDLVARSDVLVHNMRPAAPERAGVGYGQLREINPHLVYVYAGGYGASGPHSHRPAIHPIGKAVSGGAIAQMGRGTLPPPEQSLTMGELNEGSRKPYRANQPNPDQNTSMCISVAVLLGLYARQRLGVAQYIVATMVEANAYANADDFFWYEGRPPRPLGGPRGIRPQRPVPAVPGRQRLGVPSLPFRW